MFQAPGLEEFIKSRLKSRLQKESLVKFNTYIEAAEMFRAGEATKKISKDLFVPITTFSKWRRGGCGAFNSVTGWMKDEK